MLPTGVADVAHCQLEWERVYQSDYVFLASVRQVVNRHRLALLVRCRGAGSGGRDNRFLGHFIEEYSFDSSVADDCSTRSNSNASCGSTSCIGIP